MELTTSEWLIAFEKYGHGLEVGHHDSSLRPTEQKSAERRNISSAYGISRNLVAVQH